MSKEMWGIIITLMVFVAKEVVESIRSYYKTRTEQNNIRKMLVQELGLSYQWLQNITPENGAQVTNRAHLEMIATISSQLDTTVYDTYLGQLCALPAEDVRSIYDAYQSIKKNAELSRQLRQSRDADPSIVALKYEIQRRVFQESWKATVDFIETALQQLRGKRWRETLPYSMPDNVREKVAELKSRLKEMHD